MSTKHPRPAALRPVVSASATTTSIDRRNATRTVPMLLLGVGLPRTGTSSLRQALTDLGYNDVYHMAAAMGENPRDCELWTEALEAKFEGKGKAWGRREWDGLLGHCMATTDMPCAVFWRELIAAYPDALVILTVRDSPQQWVTSQMATIAPGFDAIFSPALFKHPWAWLRNELTPSPPSSVQDMIRLIVKHTPYSNIPEKGAAYYEAFNDEVKQAVPKEKLLIMNVKEGWGPLCRFLEKEEPDWPFPRVNDAKEWAENAEKREEMLDGIFWGKLTWFGSVAAAALGGATVTWAIMSRRL